MVFPPWTIFIFLLQNFLIVLLSWVLPSDVTIKRFILEVNPELLNLEPLNGTFQTNHKLPGQPRVRPDFSSDNVRPT